MCVSTDTNCKDCSDVKHETIYKPHKVIKPLNNYFWLIPSYAFSNDFSNDFQDLDAFLTGLGCWWKKVEDWWEDGSEQGGARGAAGWLDRGFHFTVWFQEFTAAGHCV